MVPPRLQLNIFGRVYPTFLVLGVAGYAAGVVLCLVLAAKSGLSPLVIVALSATGAATCLGLVWLSKVFTEVESIVYYRHEVAVLLASAAMLRSSGQPVLPYLDIAVLGVGAMMAVGRWGCLSAGCCHGEPCRWRLGVVYGPRHAREGFPDYFVGLPMFPVPALESLLVCAVVAGGAYALLSGSLPGTVLVLYTALYGTARFILEYFRGDHARGYLWYFSEAQWTSLVLLCGTAYLSLSGRLPVYPWHLLLAGAVSVLALVTAVYYSLEKTRRHALMSPRHVQEIARGLEKLTLQTATASGTEIESIPLFSTSSGLTISVGSVRQGQEVFHHYTLSSNRRSLRMAEKAAQKIAGLLERIRHRGQAFHISSRQEGIYHIVFHGKESGERK